MELIQIVIILVVRIFNVIVVLIVTMLNVHKEVREILIVEQLLHVLINKQVPNFHVMAQIPLMLNLIVIKDLLATAVQDNNEFGVKTFGVILVILHVIFLSLVRTQIMIVVEDLVVNHNGVLVQIHTRTDINR